MDTHLFVLYPVHDHDGTTNSRHPVDVGVDIQAWQRSALCQYSHPAQDWAVQHHACRDQCQLNQLKQYCWYSSIVINNENRNRTSAFDGWRTARRTIHIPRTPSYAGLPNRGSITPPFLSWAPAMLYRTQKRTYTNVTRHTSTCKMKSVAIKKTKMMLHLQRDPWTSPLLDSTLGRCQRSARTEWRRAPFSIDRKTIILESIIVTAPNDCILRTSRNRYTVTL